jgi:ATP-binding cassette subfamily C protein
MVVQVMMVAAFATAGVSFARSITFLRFKNRSRLVTEAALWLRLLSLPAAFFRRFEAGDLAQRMQSITHIFMLLSNTAVSALFNTLFSFWTLLVMLYYSWKLTLVAGLVWIVYLSVTTFLQWHMVVAKRRMMEATGDTAGQVLQIFNGLSKFRMQGAEAQAFYLWSKKFGEQWKWNRDFRWKSNWLEIINTLQPILLTMLIFWLTMRWLDSAGAGTQAAFITFPEFMGFNAALAGFNATVTGLIGISASLLDIVPQMERLRPILEAEPETTEDKAEVGVLSGRIEISNVSFRYKPDMPPVLRNISMNIKPEQFVAIVGSSGSGKSTVLRLLLGFEKPETGSIYYDGQDLAEVNVTSVRAQMGVVLQNGQLMAGDILTNIIGSLPLTIDDAWRAAEMVGLAEDIQAMPMGMHTVVSEGASNISGGQRQRILIARAVVHRPRLIMFDEATSALDNKTQAMVTESLDRLNATRIVVAHRLSTVINADIIYVLDKGEVVESGTYTELMEKNGLFAALARRQMA